MANVICENKYKKIGFIWLFVASIFFISFIIRIYHITYADPYTDEVLYGFRSFGLIDYVSAVQQPSTWQILKRVPWWAHLSFHDHPILFFLIQHASMKVFDFSVFAMRFPSVLFGAMSAVLVFFLANRLINLRAGYIASAIIAVQSYHVWISRTGMQDSTAVFFMLCFLLLIIYVHKKDTMSLWILSGGILGLALLTKYTTFVVVPIFFLYAFIWNWNVTRKKNFWFAIILFFITITPILIYNTFLYKTLGHFDFQLSAALHQDTPEWTVRLGRQEVGDIWNRLSMMPAIFYRANSWIFNSIFIIAVAHNAWLAFKRKNKISIFLLGVCAILFFWFLIIGSTFRFVVMAIPFIAILIAHSADILLKNSKYSMYIWILLIIFFIIELMFTLNTFWQSQPKGYMNITHSQLYQTEQNFGFNELNTYIESILKGKTSALFGQPDYEFLSVLHQNYIDEQKKKGAEPYPLFIIFNQDLRSLGKLWTLQRHLIYKGWPVVPNDMYKRITGNNLEDIYRKQGIKHFLYITNANHAVLNEPIDRVGTPDDLKGILDARGIIPDIIYNRAHVPAFFVYSF